jgi:hypothetical protein
MQSWYARSRIISARRCVAFDGERTWLGATDETHRTRGPIHGVIPWGVDPATGSMTAPTSVAVSD